MGVKSNQGRHVYLAKCAKMGISRLTAGHGRRAGQSIEGEPGNAPGSFS